ncbi:hypothetical protein [Rhodomicrobium lacus]|uniref:hypothetical protein n=1 Tax=Rhodomicrobium lacus TaxID=2498452 RepID=UPI0026E388F0|nr:hypothetical protein [Rhodomicrobium lacus]WKW50439.1 hypothetical protein QMO75_14320 [Rhodomicrobium lacus]
MNEGTLPKNFTVTTERYFHSGGSQQGVASFGTQEKEELNVHAASDAADALRRLIGLELSAEDVSIIDKGLPLRREYDGEDGRSWRISVVRTA